MKATISFQWTVTIYIGLTLISCHDRYYKDGMTPDWQSQISLSLGKTRVALKNHVNNAIGIDRSNQNEKDAIPAIVHKYEALPRDEFSFWVAFILNPDIFSQSNPLDYFISKALMLRKDIVEPVRSDVKLYLQLNKFPAHYVPYAKMLSSILNCQPSLHYLRQTILNIGYFATTSPLAITLPVEFATPILSAMFSPDVLTDPNPPTLIFNKIMELSENAEPDLIPQLDNISRYGGLTRHYTLYANALRSFMQNSTELKALREYYSKMKNAS